MLLFYLRLNLRCLLSLVSGLLLDSILSRFSSIIACAPFQCVNGCSYVLYCGCSAHWRAARTAADCCNLLPQSSGFRGENQR